MPWTVVPPVAEAVRVLERMVTGPMLFPTNPPWITGICERQRTGDAMTTSAANTRIRSFIAWVNDYAASSGLDDEHIPDDPDGDVVVMRFRRTIAWHIGRLPGGRIALALQYGHLRTSVVGEGYSGRARQGLRRVLDVETARVIADYLDTVAAELHNGQGVSGPAADRMIQAARNARSRVEGKFLTPRQAEALLEEPEFRVYDNANAFLTCNHDPAKALCHPEKTRRNNRALPPAIDRCDPACANIARTETHIDQLRSEITELAEQVAQPTHSGAAKGAAQAAHHGPAASRRPARTHEDHHHRGTREIVTDQEERDAITAAMERLLAGTPLRSSGNLDIISLAEEAGLKRNKLTHKHTDLKDRFYAERRAREGMTDREAKLHNAIAQLKACIDELPGRARQLPHRQRGLRPRTAHPHHRERQPATEHQPVTHNTPHRRRSDPASPPLTDGHPGHHQWPPFMSTRPGQLRNAITRNTAKFRGNPRTRLCSLPEPAGRSQRPTPPRRNHREPERPNPGSTTQRMDRRSQMPRRDPRRHRQQTPRPRPNTQPAPNWRNLPRHHTNHQELTGQPKAQSRNVFDCPLTRRRINSMASR